MQRSVAAKGSRTSPEKLKPKTASTIASHDAALQSAGDGSTPSSTDTPAFRHWAASALKYSFVIGLGTKTRGLYPKIRKCLAQTKPSPPLLPGPQMTCIRGWDCGGKS